MKPSGPGLLFAGRFLITVSISVLVMGLLRFSISSWWYDTFELWCWRRLLRVPWTARRSNQSILKEISPEYSLEGLMLNLKFKYFGHLMQRTDSLEKTLMLGKDWRWEEKGMIEDETVGWHHWLDGHEFEQAPGAGDGQGSLVCCSPWGCKESDMTEPLNWTFVYPFINWWTLDYFHFSLLWIMLLWTFV